MQELQNIANQLKSAKEALLKADRLIKVAKTAGEDVSGLELNYREKLKKYQRWSETLKAEGYEV